MADEARLLARTVWLRRLAYAILKDWQLAEDVSQEVLLRAASGTTDGHRLRPSWLATVARNLSLNVLRERARRRLREAAAARSEEATQQHSQLETLEAHRALIAAVAELPVEQREIVMLRYFEEMDWAQLAARLQIREAAAQMRLHRALLALRARLGADGTSWRAQCLAALPGAWILTSRGEPIAAGTIMTMATTWKWTIAAGLLLLLLTFGVMQWPVGEREPHQPIAAGALEAVGRGLPEVESQDVLARTQLPEAPFTRLLPDEMKLRSVPVAGRVLHEGRPVSGAEVEARQVGSVHRTISDERGHFSLALDPAVTTDIFARLGDLRGHDSTDRWGGYPWPSMVHLERANSVKSRVQVISASDSQPILGAQVTAFLLEDRSSSELHALPIEGRGRVLASGLTDRAGELAWEEEVWGKKLFLEITARGYYSWWGDGAYVVKLHPGMDPRLRLVDDLKRPLAGVLVRYGESAYRECFTTDDGTVPAVLGWGRGTERTERPLLWVRLPSGRWWCSYSPEHLKDVALFWSEGEIVLQLTDKPIAVMLDPGWLPEGSWVEAVVGIDGAFPLDHKDPDALGTILALDHPWHRLSAGEWTTLTRGLSAPTGSVLARVQPHGACFGLYPVEEGKATVRLPPLAEVVVEPKGLPPGLVEAWRLFFPKPRRDSSSAHVSTNRVWWQPFDNASGKGSWRVMLEAGSYTVSLDHEFNGCIYHWKQGAFHPGLPPSDGSVAVELPQMTTFLRGPLVGSAYQQARILMDGYPVVGGKLGTATIDLNGRTMLRADAGGAVVQEWPARFGVPPEIFGAPTEPIHTFGVLPSADAWTRTSSDQWFGEIRLAAVLLAPNCVPDQAVYSLLLRQIGMREIKDAAWTEFQDARGSRRIYGPAVPITHESASWRFRMPSGRYAFALKRQHGQERILLTPPEGIVLQPGRDVVLQPME